VSDKIVVSNIAYLSIGNGGGIRAKGTPASIRDSLGLMDFQSIYDRNVSNYSINSLFDLNFITQEII
jgi:hypothetical protein